MRPGIPNCLHFAVDAPVAETAGNQDAVGAAQYLPNVAALHVLSINPVDLHLCLVGDTAVTEGLPDALVGIPEVDALAHHRYSGFLPGIQADRNHPVVEMPTELQGVEHFLFLLGRGSDLEAVDEDQEIPLFSDKRCL